MGFQDPRDTASFPNIRHIGRAQSRIPIKQSAIFKVRHDVECPYLCDKETGPNLIWSSRGQMDSFMSSGLGSWGVRGKAGRRKRSDEGAGGGKAKGVSAFSFVYIKLCLPPSFSTFSFVFHVEAEAKYLCSPLARCQTQVFYCYMWHLCLMLTAVSLKLINPLLLMQTLSILQGSDLGDLPVFSLTSPSAHASQENRIRGSHREKHPCPSPWHPTFWLRNCCRLWSHSSRLRQPGLGVVVCLSAGSYPSHYPDTRPPPPPCFFQLPSVHISYGPSSGLCFSSISLEADTYCPAGIQHFWAPVCWEWIR